MPDRRPPVDWWGYNTNKSPYQPARTPSAAPPPQTGGIDWRDFYGSPNLGMPSLMFNPETGMWFDPSNPLASVYGDSVTGIPLSWLDYVNRPAAAPQTPVVQPTTPRLPAAAAPPPLASGVTYNPFYTINAVYQARSKNPAGQWPSTSGLIDQKAPPAAGYDVGSSERQTQLQNWYDWAQKEGKRPGWYGGAPGSGAYQTNLGEILKGEQNWYYDPFYGNFTTNAYGSGAFPGKGTVKDNQYGADWQRRINESKGKIGPEYEKLRRKRRNLGNLPRKKQPQDQKSGGVGSGGQFGMGSFDY